MSKETALQSYTNAMDALLSHERENASVFDAHQRLAMAVIDADNALRDAVAEAGSGVSNGSFTVTYTPVTQTVYDEEIIKAKCPEAISTNERPPRITIGKVN